MEKIAPGLSHRKAIADRIARRGCQDEGRQRQKEEEGRKERKEVIQLQHILSSLHL
jgi:hypothetical protein